MSENSMTFYKPGFQFFHNLGGSSMKPRVMLAVVVACLVALAGWVAAQDTKKDDPGKDSAGGRVRGQLPQNYRQLGLSDDQKKMIYKIQGDYSSKIDELEAQVKKLRQEERQAMEKVLTDDQKQRLLKILKEKAGAGDSGGDIKPPEKK